MQAQTVLAQRYAQAFMNVFPIAQEQCAAIATAIDFFDTHSEFCSLLKAPLMHDEVKKNFLKKVLIEQSNLPHSFESLIRVLLADKRSWLLSSVLEQIVILFNQHHQIEEFVLTSSSSLDAAQISIIDHFLQKKTGNTVHIVPQIDPTLIAGLRMQSPEHLWEFSVRSQLQQLAQDLLE